MPYLTTLSTHFIYGYMASDIWLRTILIVRKETRCHHIGYSFRLTARVFYMHHPTYRIAHTTAFVTPVVEHWLEWEIAQWVHPMKDWSEDPSHHERTLLPRSYISLPEREILAFTGGFKNCRYVNILCLFYLRCFDRNTHVREIRRASRFRWN